MAPPSRKRQRVESIVTAADRAELERHYQFIPDNDQQNSRTWQQRMTNAYQSHLHRDCVVADLTRAPQQLGLRWRTLAEVNSGKGKHTCGNKHCPSYERTNSILSTTREKRKQEDQQDQRKNECNNSTTNNSTTNKSTTTETDAKKFIRSLAYGQFLSPYEVPFTYKEQGYTKTELVRLVLCLRCAPRLFSTKEPHLKVYQQFKDDSYS